MSIDLISIQAFVQAARERSFTAAGKRLSMTQSAVSKAISRLEREIGAKLFHRTTRNVILTPDGAIFFERCCQILDDLEDARQSAGAGRTMRGPLRVSTSFGLSRFVIAPNLPRFLDECPGVQVEIVTFSQRPPDLYEDHIDLVLTNFQTDDENLIVRPLGRMRVVTCAAPSYLEQHVEPKHPSDLVVGHKLLVKSLVRGPQDWIFAEGGKLSSFTPAAHAIVDNFDVLSELAVAGIGIIQTRHHIVADRIAAGQLRPILCSYEAAGTQISAIYAQNRRASPKVQAFIRFAAEQLRSHSFLPLASKPSLSFEVDD